MADNIKIEVVYATPERQEIKVLSVAPETSVLEAARGSGLETIFPEIDYESIDMGIWGKVVKKPGEQTLREGDRIELYRPLLIDPKQARLNRAAKKQAN